MSPVALVTGGGRGIGAATCRALGRAGYDVCVNYREDANAAAGVVKEIEAAGQKALAVQADVRAAADVERLFAAAVDGLGPISALVNNAGAAGPISRLDEAEPATIQAIVDVNVVGSLLCAREAVRRMSPRHGGAGGVIVNISSVAASLGSPGEYVWYAGAKAAVDGFTQGLAIELAGENIRVVAVAPGLTDTEIHADSGMPDRATRLASKIPMGRAGTPEEIAEAILWVLSDKASYVTGAVLRVGGGR